MKLRPLLPDVPSVKRIVWCAGHVGERAIGGREGVIGMRDVRSATVEMRFRWETRERWSLARENQMGTRERLLLTNENEMGMREWWSLARQNEMGTRERPLLTNENEMGTRERR